MTNRTIEQVTEKKRLLLIDDSLENIAAGYNAATQRGYQVDAAFSLEGALRFLDTNHYDVIVTDMCFQESGVNQNSGSHTWSLDTFHIGQRHKLNDKENPYRDAGKGVCKTYEDLPIEIKSGFDAALDKSSCEEYPLALGCHILRRFKYQGSTSRSLREKVIDESIKSTRFEFVRTFGHEVTGSYDAELMPNCQSSPEKLAKEIKEYNLEESGNPALGYFVVQEALKRGIPYSVITSTSHADHAIPALLTSGATSEQDISSNVFYADTSRGLSKIRRKKTFRAGRAILTEEKTPETYNLAIDIAEGK